MSGCLHERLASQQSAVASATASTSTTAEASAAAAAIASTASCDCDRFEAGQQNSRDRESSLNL